MDLYKNIKGKINIFVNAIILYAFTPLLKFLIFAILGFFILMWGTLLYMLFYFDTIYKDMILFTIYSISLLTFISHILIYIIIDDGDEKCHKEVEMFLYSRKQTTWSYLTLGLFNTFWLDIIYVVRANPGFELSYPGGMNNNFTTLISWIPLVNIFIYAKILKRIHPEGSAPPTLNYIKLYSKGKLTLYFIDNKIKYTRNK